MTLQELYQMIDGNYEQALRVLRMDKLLDTFLLMLEGSEITLEIFFVTLIIALPLGM